MLRRVDLVRADVSEERIAFIIRVKRTSEIRLLLDTANARSTLMVEAIRSSET
jgi:hypothetical protein